MKLQNSKKTSNTSTVTQDFRPPNANDYMPEPGSALESVSDQGRGTAADDRNIGDIRNHNHDGVNSTPIDFRNIGGFMRTVAAVPTWTPRSFSEQIAIYKSGATIRLYVYDTINKAWRYTALT